MPLFLLEKTHVGCFFSTGLLSRCLSICFVLYSPRPPVVHPCTFWCWAGADHCSPVLLISVVPDPPVRQEGSSGKSTGQRQWVQFSFLTIHLICFVFYSPAPLLLLFEENTHHAAMGWVLNNPWLVWLKQNEPKTNVCDSLLCFM